MAQTAELNRDTGTKVEHFDVLIVGAGISGIGGAYHMTKQCPSKSFVVLEKLESFGGTWLMHKYPGVRSDSDLYTFGYRFKPWVGPPIATAEEILNYMGEVISENDLGQHIRYGHKIKSAVWSATDNLWTITAMKLDTGEARRFTANFLWMCQGYYNNEKGYTPEWPGMADYKGQIVHPQTWPEDLDYSGKKVIVIGSGATTATIVPAMADTAGHITVVQRSPTYFIPGRNQNDLADTLREIKIDETWIHEIVRRKLLHDQEMMTQRCLKEPEVVREELFEGIRAIMGPDAPIEPHFSPKYRPWQQRIAFVPDGDLFQAVMKGQVSVETDEIACFTAKGLKLKSGKELEADIIVTATGFNLSILGDIQFTIDNKPLIFSDTVTYRGMMFTGVPNMVWVFGYFRASWTLRSDLVSDFVCQLLNHMDALGARSVSAEIPPADRDMKLTTWMDPNNFNPSYLMRGMHLLPKRGEKYEWQHTQDYWREKEELPSIDLDAAEFVYADAAGKPVKASALKEPA